MDSLTANARTGETTTTNVRVGDMTIGRVVMECRTGGTATRSPSGRVGSLTIIPGASGVQRSAAVTTVATPGRKTVAITVTVASFSCELGIPPADLPQATTSRRR